MKSLVPLFSFNLFPFPSFFSITVPSSSSSSSSSSLFIDLDTIDVSNLNRQFLFRPEHVGRPKAQVAAEIVRQFNPKVSLISHYGNVKDAKFGVSFIQSFHLVLNALDNVEARRHVNRICVAANVLLIDAGTTGYIGQITSIKRGITACYDCTPKPMQKVENISNIISFFHKIMF